MTPMLALRHLQTLNAVERLADSDIAACAGCSFYFDLQDGEPRRWGMCRRHAPWRAMGQEPVAVHISDTYPVTDYDWFCGEFVKGCHPQIVAQRAAWRQDLEQARDSAEAA